MLTRHTNELMSRLEQVADVGCAIIRKPEMLHWFGQERMTVNIWRDLQAKWEEVLEALGEKIETPLFVGDADGVWTFAWGDGLTVSENSWFKDVRDFGKRGKIESNADADEAPLVLRRR